MNMTREDGFIAAFFFLDKLWEQMDEAAPGREELGNICAEMYPGVRPGGALADPASFWIWRDALQKQGLSADSAMHMDEAQAFDVLMKFLTRYQDEGFFVQQIIQELCMVRDGSGRLSWEDWLATAKKSIPLAVHYTEAYW